MKDIEELQNSVKLAIKRLSIPQKLRELEELKTESEHSDFWADSEHASQVMQKISALNEIIEPWLTLDDDLKDLKNILALNDPSLAREIDQQLHELQKKYSGLQKILRFSGEYDASDAIISIHAGAGGTDAQDWAQMLLRMYNRWAESNNLKVTLLDESPGDEAGIKSASFELSGPYIYGKMRGEHGVHRLVRLSPFNADAKRQTSFAKVEVLPKIAAPEEVPIDETELKIDVFRSGGKGGQSVNTTDSAVRITHLPTNIVVSIQNERSQLQNKETALAILRSKLARLKEEQHLETLADIKGPNQSAEWGNQIRSYVLHPYTMVKDLRTRHETTNAGAVLDGDLNPFIDAYLESGLKDSE